MPSTEHSTVYRKTSASTKSYRKARAGLRIDDYTKAINGADSHEVALKLLAEKQRAVHARRPPRPSPQRPKEAEPGQIKDPGLRRLFERSKARADQREANASPTQKKPNETKAPDPVSEANASPTPDSGIAAATHIAEKETPSKAVKPHPHTGPYVHGVAVKMTIAAVCMRPDLSSKAKSIAVMLSLHFPHIKPSKERLSMLTGIRSDKTISRALNELRDKNLLSWKSGKSHQANEYTCLWLHPVQY